MPDDSADRLVTTPRHAAAPSPALRPFETITIVAVIGVLALALAVVALTRPATDVQSRKVSYEQAGTFGYSATAPKDSVYGSDGLVSGQPIVMGIVGAVHASFAYTLTSEQQTSLHGTAALDLTVDLGHGLTRRFTIAAPRPFTGDRVTIDGTLPLDEVRTFVTTAGRTVGGLPLGGATVTLAPHISVAGTIGGHPLEQATYAPALVFTVDGNTLAPSGSPSDTSGGSASSADPLHPASTGSLTYEVAAPNTVPLVIMHPSVVGTRIAGFSLAAVCLLLCLWFARPLRAGRSVGDRDRIEALYGGQLVRVTDIPRHEGPVADVASLEALAGLAKTYESIIMQVIELEADTYLVWDNGIMFRHRIEHPPSGPDGSEQAHHPGAAAVADTARSVGIVRSPVSPDPLWTVTVDDIVTTPFTQDRAAAAPPLTEHPTRVSSSP